ncbi:hypothetical protein BBO99_00003110 [Phytophthora kernoviae]|uniref:RxLR effector protein n=2 Tax=Phytophthora kernoviae TaxID=325452 RepID=A0A421GV52_9STRA|nr:hypothetical protein G195_003245 [Phytophthora kernoviae 00238/432]KAG2528931.1 hypothetical protein JM16_000954 [Phytophthora kernoviae]KAG2530259.1 hypothetical protein JM18_001035 [Phytophthora kernoviae]RLN44228.1 hypothetical protein BBI17_002975 [Phytophthora kernoviae]RLN82150.1 hypothetical protein BBO99_00003110 [Phytophthora kernoviae]
MTLFVLALVVALLVEVAVEASHRTMATKIGSVVVVRQWDALDTETISSTNSTGLTIGPMTGRMVSSTSRLARSPQQQQFHPQHQFQQQQLNLPSSMMIGHGGYAYPSPQGRPLSRPGNWVPSHANPRGNGSGNFIEDDFPPLGK